MKRHLPILILFTVWAVCETGLILSAAESVERFAYDSKGSRDPLVPLSHEEIQEARSGPMDLRVEGIIYDPVNGSMAVINGNTLREGDTVGSYQIVKIGKGFVVVSREGEKTTLPIRSEP